MCHKLTKSLDPDGISVVKRRHRIIDPTTSNDLAPFHATTSTVRPSPYLISLSASVIANGRFCAPSMTQDPWTLTMLANSVYQIPRLLALCFWLHSQSAVISYFIILDWTTVTSLTKWSSAFLLSRPCFLKAGFVQDTLAYQPHSTVHAA